MNCRIFRKCLSTVTFLFFIVISSNIVLAQDELPPCEEGLYGIALAVVDVSCAGETTGVATIQVDGCQCVFSQCQYFWSNGDTHHTADSLEVGTHTITVHHEDGCVLDTFIVVNGPDTFIEASIAQNISCAGADDGTAEIVPTEIAGPLTYMWSNGDTTAIATNLAAGEYSATVTNFIGCSYEEIVMIEEPLLLTYEIATIDALCGQANGSATISITEGESPFNYAWNDAEIGEETENNLSGGMHTVSITDINGCMKIAEFEIFESSLPEMSFSDIATTCGDADLGTATINATGGTAPYDYIWNDGQATNTAVGLGIGTYTPTVTDANGCSVSAEIEIEGSTPTAQIMASTTKVCIGESVDLSVVGENLTFLWSPEEGLDDPTSATPIATIAENTTYTLMVEDETGCTATTSVSLSVYELPQPSISAWNETICVGSSTQLIAIEPNGSSFSWSPIEGLNDPNINSPSASPAETTTYTVTATTMQGCTSTAEITIVVDLCNGIFDNQATLSCAIYPNPTSDFLYIDLPNVPQADVQIFNTTGQLIRSQKANAMTSIDVSNFAKGLYYVSVKANEKSYLQKVIVY
ncbi:MAG: T9SS type A sorting domain-containing protein [Chitinophagales bacterium]